MASVYGSSFVLGESTVGSLVGGGVFFEVF